MKRMLFIPVYLICIILPVHSQNNESIMVKQIFKSWIKSHQEPKMIKGVLFETRDFIILISNTVKIIDYYSGKYDLTTLDVRNLEEIKLRRKGHILKWTIIGAATGLIVGGTVGGLIMKNESGGLSIVNENNIAVAVVTAGAILGTGLGAFIGSIKLTFPIKGNQKSYNRYKNELKKRSLKNEEFQRTQEVTMKD